MHLNFYNIGPCVVKNLQHSCCIITQRCAGLRYNDQNLVEKRLILRQRKLQRYSDVVLQTLLKHYKQTSIYCPLMVDFMTVI